jgi:hypothetical protein
MAEQPHHQDLLDIIPDVVEVRRRLGATYRTARILRGLLRIAEKRQDHEQIIASSSSGREAVAT